MPTEDLFISQAPHLVDVLSQTNEQGQRVYEPAEESLPFLIKQFKVGKNWKYLLGLSDIIARQPQINHVTDKINGYARVTGLPSIEHMMMHMDAVEAAYGQGLISSPMNASIEEVTNYYADVITDRELDGATIIEKYQRGEIPLTPLEQNAFNLAEQWKAQIISSGQIPSIARAHSEEYASVKDKWDQSYSIATPTSWKDTDKVSDTPIKDRVIDATGTSVIVPAKKKRTQKAVAVKRTATSKAKVTDTSVRDLVKKTGVKLAFGNPSTSEDKLTTWTMAKYLAYAYLAIQAYKLIRERYESR